MRRTKWLGLVPLVLILVSLIAAPALTYAQEEEQPYLPESDEYRGEDYDFFNKAMAAGFELYVDQDLSKEVNHIGSFAFNPLMKQPQSVPITNGGEQG